MRATLAVNTPTSNKNMVPVFIIYFCLRKSLLAKNIMRVLFLNTDHNTQQNHRKSIENEKKIVFSFTKTYWDFNKLLNVSFKVIISGNSIYLNHEEKLIKAVALDHETYFKR